MSYCSDRTRCKHSQIHNREDVKLHTAKQIHISSLAQFMQDPSSRHTRDPLIRMHLPLKPYHASVFAIAGRGGDFYATNPSSLPRALRILDMRCNITMLCNQFVHPLVILFQRGRPKTRNTWGYWESWLLVHQAMPKPLSSSSGPS